MASPYCEACGRNLDDPHTAECPVAMEQDLADNPGSSRYCMSCGADILGNDPCAPDCTTNNREATEDEAEDDSPRYAPTALGLAWLAWRVARG
jgi:hypothetical protein